MYLDHRKKFVKLNCCASTARAPQGSILGPLMFNSYTNGIGNINPLTKIMCARMTQARRYWRRFYQLRKRDRNSIAKNVLHIMRFKSTRVVNVEVSIRVMLRQSSFGLKTKAFLQQRALIVLKSNDRYCRYF